MQSNEKIRFSSRKMPTFHPRSPPRSSSLSLDTKKGGDRSRPRPSWKLIRRLLLVDTKLFQLGRDVGTVGGGLHGGVDKEDLSVLPDVDRGAAGHLAISLGNTIRLCDGCIGVTQDRIIELERLGKFRIGLEVVAARCEVGDIEFPDLIATLTERLAFGRSASGEGFRIPGHDHGLLALEVGERIGLAIASFQGEIRSVVANREVGTSTCREADEPDKESGGEK